jgi:thiamine kinase
MRAVPGCEDGSPPRAVVALPDGGRANRVLRIDTRAGRFVLRERLDGTQPRPGARAADELVAHRAAAAAGLAPAVIAAAPDGHWLLMDFVDGRTWDRALLADDARLGALAARLRQLQGLPPPALTPFDPVAILEAQRARVPAAVGDDVLDDARRLWERLAKEPPVLNHGDLSVANLVGDGPMLVDWEYAQLAPRGYDLACLLSYYPELAGRPALVDDPSVGPGHLGSLRRLFALLDAAWHRAEAAGFRAARPAE